MNRHEFEALRDLPGKRIRHQTITLTLRNELSPLLTADNVVVENSLGKDIRLNVTYNPETDSKVVNVQVAGTGPICRLCVDATPHKPCGRSHKHSLQADRCPERNLPDGVIDRGDLAGKNIAEVFREFCIMAQIDFTGTLEKMGGGE
jgi:hypothetical protein